MKHLIAAMLLTVGLASPALAQSNTPQPMQDCSVTLTTGGTSQTILAANPNRHYLFIENPSATVSGVSAESLFLNSDAAAASDGKSIELANVTSKEFTFPGYVPTGDVRVNAATTAHKIICKWN